MRFGAKLFCAWLSVSVFTKTEIMWENYENIWQNSDVFATIFAVCQEIQIY
jgi:hypothetical protein